MWFQLCLWSLLVLLAAQTAATAAPQTTRRVAFLVDSWYPWSHADVIGRRLHEGYRIGDRDVASPVRIVSVYPDAPRPRDQTRTLATRYGFRVASSIAEALLEQPGATPPRLAADGILVATREDPPGTAQPQSPHPRVQVIREVLRILDLTGSRAPLFLDKMLAASWTDAQTIAAEVSRRGIPVMAGSVLPFVPLDQPLRTRGIEVGVVMASTPYWAFAFHAAELLQGFMEQRAARETGVAEIRSVGGAYWSMPDRERWGVRVADALLASAKTRRGRPAVSGGLRAEPQVLLIRYADGARGVLALVPEVFDDREFLLGAQYADGAIETSGLVLAGEPYDHFGYLVHALVELFTSGRAPIPVERTLLTTGIVLFGQQAGQAGSQAAIRLPGVSYAVPRARP